MCDRLRRWWRSALRVVMSKEKLRPEEEYAAKRLQETLTELGVKSTWKPGDDPPDLVFEVEGCGRWAVEVTALHQYITKDGKEESRLAVTEPLRFENFNVVLPTGPGIGVVLDEDKLRHYARS